MKIKNIMFSGFAAAIFAGVCGAASAATTYELTSKSYVDNKFTAEATRSDSYADQAEADAIAAAKLYADGLATNYDAAGSAAAAQAAAEATADAALTAYKTANDAAVKENKDVITAMDAAYKTADAKVLEDANKYTDDEIAELNQSLSGTSTNLGALTERVTTAEGEIDALQAADTTIRSEFAAADKALEEAYEAADATLDGKISANTQAITAEATARETADTAMAEDIADLVAADQTLQGNIETEASAREAADTAISNKIGTVAEGKTVVGMIADAQTAATYDDTAVRGLISAEATTRETADTAMAEDIADLVAADTAIRGEFAAADATTLSTAKGYTDTEIDKLEASLGTTSGDLTELTTRVTTAEGEIDDLQAADTAIRSEFADADTALEEAINAEHFVSANGILTTKGGYLVISDGEGNVSLNQVAVVNGDGTKDIITGNTLQQ